MKVFYRLKLLFCVVSNNKVCFKLTKLQLLYIKVYVSVEKFRL